jgi:hypothetical protein
MSPDEKIKHLLEEKKKYEDKLTNLYKHFRGVSHENAAAEMRYTTIKVYESHLQSIKDELKQMGIKE